MKLNKLQIEQIDNQLEKLGVVYVDYKFEILDHIASEVEKLMDEKNTNFDQSLSFVLEKWNPKFKKSTDLNFGLIWVLPEILKQKAKKIYWKKMLQLLAAAVIFTPILLLFKDSFPENLIKYSIWAILLIQFMGYIVIRISKSKTTFGFLYKQQFFAFLFLYFIALYSLNSNAHLFEQSIELVFPLFFMISLLTMALVASFSFFKAHFKELNKTHKLI